MNRILLLCLALTSSVALATDPYEEEVMDYIYNVAFPTGDMNHPAWFKAGEKIKVPLSEGAPWAELQASLFYEYGAAGYPQDIKKASELLLSSANNGYTPAMTTLARKYESGFLGSIDLKEAVAWYEKAALSGSNSAVEKLENAYTKGKLGLKPNPKLAEKWRALKVECNKP